MDKIPQSELVQVSLTINGQTQSYSVDAQTEPVGLPAQSRFQERQERLP